MGNQRLIFYNNSISRVVNLSVSYRSSCKFKVDTPEAILTHQFLEMDEDFFGPQQGGSSASGSATNKASNNAIIVPASLPKDIFTVIKRKNSTGNSGTEQASPQQHAFGGCLQY